MTVWQYNNFQVRYFHCSHRWKPNSAPPSCTHKKSKRLFLELSGDFFRWVRWRQQSQCGETGRPPDYVRWHVTGHRSDCFKIFWLRIVHFALVWRWHMIRQFRIHFQNFFKILVSTRGPLQGLRPTRNCGCCGALNMALFNTIAVAQILTPVEGRRNYGSLYHKMTVRHLIGNYSQVAD